MMFEGIAVGGPLDGIKLTAGESWDGRVKRKGKEGKSDDSAFYRGQYRWSWVLATWEWRGRQEKP